MRRGWWCLGLLFGLAAQAEVARENVLVIVRTGSSVTVEQLISPLDGRIAFSLPELRAAVIELPVGRSAALKRDPRLLLSTSTPIAAADRAGFDPAAQRAIDAFQSLLPQASGAAEPLAGDDGEPGSRVEPLFDDGLRAAAWWELRRPAALGAAEELVRASGAGWENTSEFLAGKVSINLLLPESDGSRDPASENWTAAQESLVLNETLAALSTLRTLHSGAALSFVVHLISGRSDVRLRTGYEPITHAADPYGTAGEELWVVEVLGKLGYSAGERAIRSRQLADATRRADASDWAVNLFVVNSAKDKDGKFADGRFAYAWIGGPHAVLTSDNGTWGATLFDKVVLHELHHAFFALDQYGASACACDQASGYFGELNDNCENGCAFEPCVMRDNGPYVSATTRRLVGSIDQDHDGTADVLQVPPETTIALAPGASACGTIVALAGTAAVVPYPNQNELGITPARSISLNTIADVQVRVDGGSWQSGLADADDGSFDEPQETFSVTLSLSLDRHAIEVRAIDDRGNLARGTGWTVDASETARPLDDSLQVAFGPTGTVLTWNAAPGAGSYRIRRSADPRQLAASSGVIDVAATSWNDVMPGTQFYSVTSLDGCAREAP